MRAEDLEKLEKKEKFSVRDKIELMIYLWEKASRDSYGLKNGFKKNEGLFVASMHLEVSKLHKLLFKLLMEWLNSYEAWEVPGEPEKPDSVLFTELHKIITKDNEAIAWTGWAEFEFVAALTLFASNERFRNFYKVLCHLLDWTVENHKWE